MMNTYTFDSEGKYLVLKGKSKLMFKVFYDTNKFYFVSLRYNCCFCQDFEKNKKCEHLDLVRKIV